MTRTGLGSHSKSTLVRTGDWFFKYRNMIFTLIAIVLFLGFRPVPLDNNPDMDKWLDFVGICFAIAGSSFRAWAIGLEYIKRGGVDKKVFAESLIVGGMFSVCRNPLYLGNLLILIGLFLVYNNPWIYCLGGGFFLFAYSAIIAAEEYFLQNKFGAEYEEYCRSVPRFMPDFRRYSQGTRGMSFSWRRPLIKDYSSIYAWIIAILLINLQEYILWGLGEISLIALWPYWTLTIVASFVAIVVRFFKKAGRLTE